MRPNLKRVWSAALASIMTCSVSIAADRMTVVSSHAPGKSKAKVSAKGYLSVYIQADGKAILFDTGRKVGSLSKKLDEMDLDPDLIEAVVFSHNQLKGIPDLSGVLTSAGKQKKVFVPGPIGDPGPLKNLDAKMVEVLEVAGVAPDAWLVGPMRVELKDGTTSEQVLVLDKPDGLVIVVGCSHSGVVSVVEEVKRVFGPRKIKLIAGGFHLQTTSKNEIKEISLEFQTMGIDNLALSSCTGQAALKIFRKEWGDRVVSFDSGDTIGF